MNQVFTRFATAAVAVVVMLTAVGITAQVPTPAPGQPIRLQAWAVSMSNVATGANNIVQIRVEKWSTAEDRKQLITAFLEKKQDGLLKVLEKMPVKGRINVPGRQGPDRRQVGLGWDLRYAWQEAGEDGGQRIMVATDRYMSFEEVRANPRTADYPFTFAEIRLKKDGTGEGKLAYAVQLRFDKEKNAIIFENYSTEPVRLQEVKVEK